jgi:hypothetical protein
VAQPNPLTAQRAAAIDGLAAPVVVNQAARSSCRISLVPGGLTVDNAGVTASPMAVAAESGCRWSATSGASWITVNASAAGQGNGAFTITVSPNNTGAPRFGAVTIGDAVLPVVQAIANPLGGTRFVPVTFCRVVDTRIGSGKLGGFGPGYLAGGRTRDIAVPLAGCNIPGIVRAYSLNVTVVPYGPLGYLTVWPQGQPVPLASNLNSPKGVAVANAVIVPAGAGGGISVFASDATELILDINGYFVSSADSFGALAFYPLTPCRVMDTRAGQGTTGPFGPPSMPAGGSARTVPMTSSRCGIPPVAAAYSVNFTVVPGGRLGYLSAWPSGQPQPQVSTLNSWDGAVLANAAIVPAGGDGSIQVLTQNDSGSSDVILDVNGYFAPPGATAGLSFYPLTPCRAADTRPGEGKTGAYGPPALTAAVGERTLPLVGGGCGLPASAKAYALNITAVPRGYLGYLSVWPADQARPLVSTLNSMDGRIVANAALVPASAAGAVSIFAQVGAAAPADVVVDVFGYFAP